MFRGIYYCIYTKIQNLFLYAFVSFLIIRTYFVTINMCIILMFHDIYDGSFMDISKLNIRQTCTVQFMSNLLNFYRLDMQYM